MCEGGRITGRLVTSFVRTWLPAVVVAGGVAAICIGRSETALEGGAGIIGAGLSIWLFNVLLRVGYSGEVDRHHEQDARDFFDRTGVWPDEAGDELRRDESGRPRRQLRDSS